MWSNVVSADLIITFRKSTLWLGYKLFDQMKQTTTKWNIRVRNESNDYIQALFHSDLYHIHPE